VTLIGWYPTQFSTTPIWRHELIPYLGKVKSRGGVVENWVEYHPGVDTLIELK
jgi:hypothetical protein